MADKCHSCCGELGEGWRYCTECENWLVRETGISRDRLYQLASDIDTSLPLVEAFKQANRFGFVDHEWMQEWL